MVSMGEKTITIYPKNQVLLLGGTNYYSKLETPPSVDGVYKEFQQQYNCPPGGNPAAWHHYFTSIYKLNIAEMITQKTWTIKYRVGHYANWGSTVPMEYVIDVEIVDDKDNLILTVGTKVGSGTHTMPSAPNTWVTVTGTYLFPYTYNLTCFNNRWLRIKWYGRRSSGIACGYNVYMVIDDPSITDANNTQIANFGFLLCWNFGNVGLSSSATDYCILYRVLDWHEEEEKSIPTKGITRKGSPTSQANYYSTLPRTIEIECKVSKTQYECLEELKHGVDWVKFWDADDSYIDEVWIESLTERWARYEDHNYPWRVKLVLICRTT